MFAFKSRVRVQIACSRTMVDVVPDVSDEKPVGSAASTLSDASSSRVLPRVEAGDAHTAWDEFGSWKLQTARLIRFYGIMSVEVHFLEVHFLEVHFLDIQHLY